MKIQDENKQKFAEDFIERYSNRGFGSMNKNEFEVLIFDLLRRYGDLQNKSNYNMSLILRIPENKVKRLAYEADLRYPNGNADHVKEEFFRLIAKANFRSENKKIYFVVENQYVRSAINAKLKELGHFSDTSFNSEIVSVHLDAFIDLLYVYYPKEAVKRIVDDCKSVAKNTEEEITFKSIMKQFVDGLANKTGGLVASSVFAAISGGATSVTELVGLIKNALWKR